MENNTDSSPSEESSMYRNYVLAMLTLVYVFNFVDRQLLVILQESIKKELSLSDTQLGLLSGFTFAIFYVTMGIPIAHLADKGNRKNLVAISLGIWSMMTAFSGLVKNYIQLLMARIGVGIGEAGGSPPAHAMISDYFPPAKRATALSIYSTGIYIGVSVGFLMGGYLNQQLGWRTAFFALGIPGVIFSLLFFLTVKEPRRGATDVGLSQAIKSQSFGEVFKLLFSKKTFVYLAFATGFNSFCIYGLSNWEPSFLARMHGMKSSEIGLSLGLIKGVAGGLGTLMGGVLTDYFGKRDKRWHLKIPAYAIVLALPTIVGALFFKNTGLSLLCISMLTFLTGMYIGPSVAVTHSLVPASMRAFSSAILFFVLNIIGLGFGPLLIGVLSDYLTPTLGTDSLRWAMTITMIAGVGSALFFIIASRKIIKDLSQG